MFVFNRFRAGIVPLAQIEGIMQFMMQWKLQKKAVVLWLWRHC